MMFIDGFNLYYPISEYAEANNANHLKWLDLWKLSEVVARKRGEDVVGVTYCTAYRRGDHEAQSRHRKYVLALENYGVETILGHYITSPTAPCWNCSAVDDKQSEKQSDINVALSLFRGAMNDSFDVAYLLSADSDQGATSRHFAEEFPDKILVSVTPPNKPHSKQVTKHNGDIKYSITMLDVERCRMPSVVMRVGKDPLRCPREYELPKPS